jgi:hypothetical protein
MLTVTKESIEKSTSFLNHSIDSAKDNKALFTDRQAQRAKHARQIYHALGSPSLHHLTVTISSNQSQNLPITIDNI